MTPFNCRIKRLLESAEEEEETLSSVQCMRLAIRIEKCLRQIQSDLTPKFSQVILVAFFLILLYLVIHIINIKR